MKEKLEAFLQQQNVTIWQAIGEFKCCRSTIINWLTKYNIQAPKGFYNRGRKIGRPKGIPCSKKQKLLLSSKFKGVKNPFYGKKHSAITKTKMSDNHADFSGNANPFCRALLLHPEKRKEHKERCKNNWQLKDQSEREKIARKRLKGFGEISGSFWARVKSNAKAKNRKVDIVLEYCWELFIKQKRKCALSGIPIKFGICYGETTASLDRIDNKLDYIENNVQWVHKVINMMKRTLTEEEFIKYCRKVVEHNERIETVD